MRQREHLLAAWKPTEEFPTSCAKNEILNSEKPFSACWAHSKWNLSLAGYFNFVLKIS